MTRIEDIRHRAVSNPEEASSIDIMYLLYKLEIAEKALEKYTEDDQYCARCDGVTYDTENGNIAREALRQIRE